MQWMHDHALWLLLAGATMFTAIWVWHFRKRLQIPAGMIPVIAVLHTLTGVVFVRVFAVLETWNPENAGNMSLFGAVFFMPVLYFSAAKILKRDTKEVFDVFTVPMIVTLLFARGNCIIAGCCRGVLIPGTQGLRVPTRLAEMIFYGLLAVCFTKRLCQGKTEGKIYPLYMTAYGIFRFVIEWFREADSPLGVIHMGHIWALTALGIGWSIYAELGKGSKKKRGYRHA